MDVFVLYGQWKWHAGLVTVQIRFPQVSLNEAVSLLYSDGRIWVTKVFKDIPKGE